MSFSRIRRIGTFFCVVLFAANVDAATASKPTLKIETLDGKQFDLSAQAGNWVIINYWATWCVPCLKELPDISAYVSAHKDKVRAIGLAFEDSDKADIVKFLSTHPLSFPVAQLDVMAPPKDFDTPVGLPNTYVIAPDGHVAKAFLGPITSKDLDAVIVGAKPMNDAASADAIVVARFIVSGKVQGVFYRAATRSEAQRLGLHGHARNLDDGSVEVVAEGGAEAIDRLEAWLQDGPPLADVHAVQRSTIDQRPATGFRVF